MSWQSVIINGKDVQSIKIGDGYLFRKSTTPVGTQWTFGTAGSHSFTAPSAGTYKLDLFGGGGGGGGFGARMMYYGAHGAVGEYSTVQSVLSAGSTYTIHIGAGGAGGANDQGGADGDDTTFDSHSAYGGSGGASGNEGSRTTPQPRNNHSYSGVPSSNCYGGASTRTSGEDGGAGYLIITYMG